MYTCTHVHTALYNHPATDSGPSGPMYCAIKKVQIADIDKVIDNDEIVDDSIFEHEGFEIHEEIFFHKLASTNNPGQSGVTQASPYSGAGVKTLG